MPERLRKQGKATESMRCLDHPKVTTLLASRSLDLLPNSIKWEPNEKSLKLVKGINSAFRESYKKEIEMRAACAELRMNILYSEVLKNELKNSEGSKKPQRRGKKDSLTPLQDKNSLKIYTSEIIPKLTIPNPEKFFTSY
ncbi:hypothetical protein ACTXT7_014218 [Hymenolepis weldensis]